MSPIFPTSRVFCLASIAAVALAVLSGCGGSVIDAYKTEAAVLAEVQVKTDTRISSATCPTDVEVVPGDRFTCTVTAEDGAEATVYLRILNEDADVDMIRLARN